MSEAGNIVYAMPIISAFIGWITNKLALWSLFHPRKPFSFIGMKFHGLIPKRRGDLAESVSETIDEHILSTEDLVDSALSMFAIKYPLILAFKNKIKAALTQTVDVKGTIRDKFNNIELDDLEKMVLDVTNSEMKHIEILGAILGFFIGVVQVVVTVCL